jgi:hypothetical protein
MIKIHIERGDDKGQKMNKCGPFHLLNPDGNCEHYLVLLNEGSMDEK